jgi:hypothetical protein
MKLLSPKRNGDNGNFMYDQLKDPKRIHSPTCHLPHAFETSTYRRMLEQPRFLSSILPQSHAVAFGTWYRTKGCPARRATAQQTRLSGGLSRYKGNNRRRVHGTHMHVHDESQQPFKYQNAFLESPNQHDPTSLVGFDHAPGMGLDPVAVLL